MFVQFLKNIFFMCLCVVGFSTTARAQTWSSVPQTELGELRITNRAQCSLDSNSPNPSVFLIIDGYNAGKLSHAVAKNVGENPTDFSSQGMTEFRISATRLVADIIDRVRSGRLPLLPTDVSNQSLSKYSQKVASCGQKVYCEELSSYIGQLWSLSVRKDLAGKALATEWQKIDNFKAKNFTTTTISKQSCAYLKRFSPLQAHLHHSALNVASLSEMAQAVLKKNDYVGACDDLTLESRNAALQLDLLIDDPATWEAKGFDFWNSVKIYLSWAWRNAPEMNTYAPQFGYFFRSLALEESVMLVPNGCRSLVKPACDSEGLAINSLRELAKPNTLSEEHVKDVPGRIENTLLERGARSVNNDFLGTRSYDTASEWVQNFRKQFIQSRGTAKNKFQSSVQFMNIIADSMSAADLLEYTKSLALRTHQDSNLRDELYYMCTEARLAGDKRLDFMRSDVERMGNLSSMLKATQNSSRDITELIKYFSNYADGLIPVCDQLEKLNNWSPQSDYTPNKNGFHIWAKEMMNIPLTDEKGIFIPPVSFTFGAPFLTWSKEVGAEGGNVICASAIDCGRRVIKALVDLHSVSVYADAFLPISSTVSSPNIFNPYNELQACKIYDPWYQTKRAQKVFMSDLANTVLFGFNALPIYLSADFSPNKVTSFNQLVKSGKINFDPNIEAGKMQSVLVADFGAMLGAPCAVAIAPTSLAAPSVYAFEGISVNYCSSKQKAEGVANKPNDIVPGKMATNSYCGGCSLNFVSVATATAGATGINPIKAGIFLFRAIYNFSKNIKDPVNVPKVHVVNLNHVADAYKRYGRIPETCVDVLGKGLKCFQNICASRTAEYFEKVTGGVVKSVELEAVAQGTKDNKVTEFKRARIKTNVCSGEVVVKVECAPQGRDFVKVYHPTTWDGIKGSCKEKF